MKINHLFKLVSLLFALSGVVACSTTSEEVDSSEVASSGESGIDATTRRTQELDDAAAARAAAAEERMRRSALANRVFYFDFDIADFRQADRDVLNFHAQDLTANPSKRVRLEGHADERGTREYNLALGENRALSVKEVLGLYNLDDRIIVVSYGEEDPVLTGSNEAAWEKNRRVELVYY